MYRRRAFLIWLSLFVLGALCVMYGTASSNTTPDANQRVFEIRTYTTEPGKLADLLKRFREHTCQLFEKHGMTDIGYWVPTDGPRAQNTLIYILAHKSRDAAKQSWQEFQADPDWIQVKEASEANGKIVTKVESIYAAPTDFSALK